MRRRCDPPAARRHPIERGWGALLCLLVAVLTASACATRGDIDDLMLEHQRIRERQDDLEARLGELARNLTDLMQGVRADFKADLGALREQMSGVEAALRGTETRIEQLRRYQPRPTPVPVAPGDTTAPLTVDEVGLYNGAITDYQQGRLDLAREGFAEYLRLFPQGLNASDAQYWLGIIDYDQGRYEEAIEQLRRVERHFPDSAKAPLALRKIGDAYRALGDPERGEAVYRDLIDRYPNSSEAEAARRELGS